MQTFAQLLLHWYDQYGRHDLPWQHDINPYRVWLSETMLQQTQVTTVIPYFLRFTEQLSDVMSLANAEEDTVLHLWSGLGYYSRARNLHKAAKMIRDEFGAQFPTQFDDILSLPGIGRSTAGAIASIALNQHYAILDGNVKRVLCRLHAVEGWPGHPSVATHLWQLAEHYTPPKRVADYTQAIMDLGATLCKRSNPECERCPVQSLCLAYQRGQQKQFPQRKVKKTLPIKHTYLLIALHEQKIWLEKRPSHGIWGGLWSVPEFSELSELEQFAQRFTANADFQYLPDFRHTFSHYHLDIQPVLLPITQTQQQVMDSSNQLWYNIHHKETIGLPAPISKLLRSIENYAKDDLLHQTTKRSRSIKKSSLPR